MKIYTKTGDSGTTGLFGGPRVLKSSARIAAYGTVDELNAMIGLARSFLSETDDSEIDRILGDIQVELFVLGADLATPMDTKVDVPRVEPKHVEKLEMHIDRMEDELPPLTQFILPGGATAGAALHTARTVCRRAERLVVELQQKESIGSEALVFLNRLSDFLFVASRFINRSAGQEEQSWTPG
ncbi:MAG: cob(I)yrinic acid a,c-diamide adenosyltransferase [Rhodothermia bacterium]|nr:MAG: cob(I)yrinic acid a,c-diamide adenosyltransferase [Rhodothermia bacterium]